MSSEIEEHVTKKYEIKKRLGKGVSWLVYVVTGTHYHQELAARLQPCQAWQETNLNMSMHIYFIVYIQIKCNKYSSTIKYWYWWIPKQQCTLSFRVIFHFCLHAHGAVKRLVSILFTYSRLFMECQVSRLKIDCLWLTVILLIECYLIPLYSAFLPNQSRNLLNMLCFSESEKKWKYMHVYCQSQMKAVKIFFFRVLSLSGIDWKW